MTELPDIQPDKIEKFRQRLLAWWDADHRSLPWRETRDPYRILVAEVMLQQTQVDRVVPHWQRWLDRFPTTTSLAIAPVAEVIRMWKGLGYNRRAVNLQRTAQAVEERGGGFPVDVRELVALSGIGPYTAGAIACFAFEQDVAFIDTNMRRVLHRIFVGVDIPAPLVRDKVVLELAAHCVPEGDGWRWNQALIEFGALQCTARKPLCMTCPMQDTCLARPTIQYDLANAQRTPRGRAPRFEDTNRFARGRVIDSLRLHTGEGLSLKELGPAIRDTFAPADLPWLFEIVQGLERDGLARIAEDNAGYDAGDPSTDIAGVRITLP